MSSVHLRQRQRRRIKREIARVERRLFEYEPGDRCFTVDLCSTPTTFTKQRKRVTNTLYRYDPTAIVTGWFEVSPDGVTHIHGLYRGSKDDKALTKMLRRLAIKGDDGKPMDSAVHTTPWDGRDKWITYRFKGKPFVARATFDYGGQRMHEEERTDVTAYEVDQRVWSEWYEPDPNDREDMEGSDSSVRILEHAPSWADETSNDHAGWWIDWLEAEQYTAGHIDRDGIKARGWSHRMMTGKWLNGVGHVSGRLLPRPDLIIRVGKYEKHYWRLATIEAIERTPAWIIRRAQADRHRPQHGSRAI